MSQKRSTKKKQSQTLAKRSTQTALAGYEEFLRDLKYMRDFLLELGSGFAFMGSQYHLEVGGQDFYLDLLFYHLHLHCLIVFDVKTEDFKPEFAGKMNFYLSALDDLVRHPDDQSSVSIILCKGKNKVIAEYALRDISKPIGVSEFRFTR